ncbi:MAG: hypothetical protein O7B99_07300, partial [Planctomycetota bacterium]|nr:hypothetical protein [Planctomycetota bacterium]
MANPARNLLPAPVWIVVALLILGGVWGIGEMALELLAGRLYLSLNVLALPLAWHLARCSNSARVLTLIYTWAVFVIVVTINTFLLVRE